MRLTGAGVQRTQVSAYLFEKFYPKMQLKQVPGSSGHRTTQAM